MTGGPEFPDGVEGFFLGGGTWWSRRLNDAGEWIGIHEWHQCRPGDWGAGAISVSGRGRIAQDIVDRYNAETA